MGARQQSLTRYGVRQAAVTVQGLIRSMSRGRSHSRSLSQVRGRSESMRAVSRHPTIGKVAGSTSRNSVLTTGTSLRLPRVIKREKQPSVRRRPYVNVPSNFRAKVDKVIEDKNVKGYFQSDQIEFISPQTFGNTQNVVMTPNAGDVSQGQLFGASRVLHVASRLWKDKAASKTFSEGDPANFGAEGENGTLTQLKFDVRKQWWEFDVKNNSHRTLTVVVNQVGVKRMGNNNNPLEAWEKGLIFDQQNKTLISNIPSITPETFGTLPETSSEFRNSYTNKVIKFIIEPGQTYGFTVQGPAMVYDMSEYFLSDDLSGTIEYQQIQKQDIYLMWQTHADLVMGHDGQELGTEVYGYGNVDNAGDFEDLSAKLIVHCRYKCHLLMPETTGFTGIPSGTTLDKRINVSCIDDFKDRASPFTNIIRLDEVEPTKHEVI